ncbi:MAG: LysE family transporter [Cyanobacteria bacterium J06576_12]
MQGRFTGFVSGCGAATADGFYGCVAAFGLSAFSNFLVAHTASLQLVGGLFLSYLGLKTFFTEPVSSSVIFSETPSDDSSIDSADSMSTDSTSALPLLSAYSTTLALTLTNPATILSFLFIFAGLGITQSDYLQSVTLVSGVFSGSLLWWLVLVSGVAYLRSRLTPQRLARFNSVSSKIFGLIILGFGLVALVASIRS